MQNRQLGKGAERKERCALFLCDPSEKTDHSYTEEIVDTKLRKDLAKILEIYSPRILAVGYCGLAAAGKEVREKKEALAEAFPSWVMRQVEELCTEHECLDPLYMTQRAASLLQTAERKLRISKELPAMVFPLGEGGIYKGLWEIGETLFCGIDTEFALIPVKQSIIEICNLCDIDPYASLSFGACLIVCGNDREALRLFAEAGIPADAIGQINRGPDRIVRMAEGIRYLTGRD